MIERMSSKFGEFTSMSCRLPQYHVLKCVPRDYFPPLTNDIIVLGRCRCRSRLRQFLKLPINGLVVGMWDVYKTSPCLVAFKLSIK